MNFGYVKIATFTPSIKVADVEFNTQKIVKAIQDADSLGVQLLVFPELCVTGSTCADLFYSDVLLNSAKKSLSAIARATRNKKMLVFVGLPIKVEGLIYNVSAGIFDGAILGFVPKSNLCDMDKPFASASDKPIYIDNEWLGKTDDVDLLPLYKNIMFCDAQNQSFKVGVELGQDISLAISPSIYHSMNGARVIVNLSASNEFLGQAKARANLVKAKSQQTLSAYCLANAGDGESTTDMVFSGHSVIAEKGEILSQTVCFENGFAIADIDLEYLDFERSKQANLNNEKQPNYVNVGFNASRDDNRFERIYNQTPFIVSGEQERILQMQAQGLRKRLEHTNASKAVIGLSGGLDSTLAIIVAVKAIELAGKKASDVLALTMPCFGTTERTLDNSLKLAKALGVTIKKVDISRSVKSHLKDLNHPLTVHDAAYENAQARERTQLLMDMANMYNGVVIGTGDLSELALGWATYNGDHMSNYAVNASIPKTLVRNLVEHVALTSKGKLKSVLLDILDTPVSPELLPAVDSKISQKTEDLVGPYILHDFFLYNMIMRGFSPSKTYMVACKAFANQFDSQTILKWLKTFVRRFFSQQFKRSCMPDGVMVTPVSFSPRSSFSMPSDAVAKLWLEQLENI